MAQYKKKKNAASKKDTRRGIRIVWISFAAFWVVLVLFFTMLSLGWLGFMPSFEELENPRSNLASEVWSADGEVLGYIGIENRSSLTYREITNDGKNLNLIHALVATEDVRFYDHAGIDARSLARVFFKTLVGRHSSSGGGSTITQQLAKNLFPRERKSKLGLIHSKFKEWVVAVKLEHNYSKEEILAMYLNTVDFGSNAYGIETAAHTFFDKSPSELTVDEAAVLVGLLKAPTSYSPVLHPDNATRRRNVVMSQMNSYKDPATGEKYLSDEDFEKLKEKAIDMSHYRPISHNDGAAPYLREYIRGYMKDWCGSHKKSDGTYYDVHKDGLRIYTTIDSRMQAHAEKAVEKHMKEVIQPAFFKELARRKGNPFNNLTKEQEDHFLTLAMKASDRYYQMKQDGASESEIKKYFKEEKVKMRVFSWNGPVDTVMTPWDSLIYVKKFLNAGLMSVETGTGYVKAYVGGINYRYFKYDNVMQSRRQVGSTFKPFVYTMALQDLDMNPYTLVPNTEVCIGDWCPRNSSHQREGEMVTLKWALANSINWVSAYLMKAGGANGPNMVINIARKMGVTSPIDPVPAISVGAAEITVYEMAGAMATFANQGEYVQPIFITRIEARAPRGHQPAHSLDDDTDDEGRRRQRYRRTAARLAVQAGLPDGRQDRNDAEQQRLLVCRHHAQDDHRGVDRRRAALHPLPQYGVRTGRTPGSAYLRTLYATRLRRQRTQFLPRRLHQARPARRGLQLGRERISAGTDGGGLRQLLPDNNNLVKCKHS